MKKALLAVVLLGACGASEDPEGAYEGTLTMMQTGTSPRIISVLAHVDGRDDYVQLDENGAESTLVSCTFTMASWDGADVSFGCAPRGCDCLVNDLDLDVITASGSILDDMLTLSFTGSESIEQMPYTAEFVGAFIGN